MPFTGAGDHSLLPVSAPFLTHNALNTSSDSTSFATPGAPTWPPSAASSTPTLESSAAVPNLLTDTHLVSSPPTSHATSFSRTRSSPLRPSLAANVLDSPTGNRDVAKAAAMPPSVVTGLYVANSDPEDDEHDTQSDGAETSRKSSLSCSPDRSSKKEGVAAAELTDGSSLRDYIEMPSSLPSTMQPRSTPSSSKNPKKHRPGSDASDTGETSAPIDVDDDAAYAAALAAQEATLARRRPTRSARKQVSYSPSYDLDGRPLQSKRPKVPAVSSSTVSASKSRTASKETSTAHNAKTKRTSRAFSDNGEQEDADEHLRSQPSSSAKSDQHIRSEVAAKVDADLTDDDVGFKAPRRKKPKDSKHISVISDDENEEPASRSTRRRTTKADRCTSREKANDDVLIVDDEESDRDGDALILSAPTSVRRSSRKSAPTPKKQREKGKGKGKAKQQKTFNLQHQGEDEEELPDVSEEVDMGDVQNLEQPMSSISGQDVVSQEEVQDEAAEAATIAMPLASSTPSGTRSSASPIPTLAPNTTHSDSTPHTVAIKRICTGSSSSSGSGSSTASPTLHAPSASGAARSFFGKPLTMLLSTSAARRPGLTRKHNIPSLLSHRGAPKPPVRGLAVSKRRMQDDDYEYDAEYEALIAKDKTASDDEHTDADRQPNDDQVEEEDADVQEYD